MKYMMHELPLVSIAIPTFNQEEYILQAVKSALSQTYPRLEVIVSDDHSTDHTREVLKTLKADARLKYFINEPGLGRVKNYRRSLYEYASGDWFINVDGDDFFTDVEFVEDAMGEMVACEEIVLFY